MFDDTKNVTAFSTYSAYSSVQAAAKLLSTSTTHRQYITDIILWSDTIGAITLFQNTTTTKAVFYNSLTGSSQHFSFNTPIEIPTSSALHITTAPTNASIFISGFLR